MANCAQQIRGQLRRQAPPGWPARPGLSGLGLCCAPDSLLPVPCPTRFVCCACPPVPQFLSTADDPGGVTWAMAGRPCPQNRICATPSRLHHAFPRSCQAALPQRPTRRAERPTRGVLLSDDVWPPTKPPLGCPMQTTSVCVMLL